MVALIQTPHRFRTKRQLTRDSAEYRYRQRQLQRCKKPLPVNVLIADFEGPLPRYPAGLTVGALAGGPLKPGGRVEHGFAFRFLQASLPSRGRKAVSSSLSFQAVLRAGQF